MEKMNPGIINNPLEMCSPVKANSMTCPVVPGVPLGTDDGPATVCYAKGKSAADHDDCDVCWVIEMVVIKDQYQMKHWALPPPTDWQTDFCPHATCQDGTWQKPSNKVFCCYSTCLLFSCNPPTSAFALMVNLSICHVDANPNPLFFFSCSKWP